MRSFKNSSVFILVTILTILSRVIDLIGKSTIKENSYRLYSTSRFASGEYSKLQKLKKEQIQINRERNSISAQDNYAKWTKLNRKFDQVSEEVKRQESLLAKNKAWLDSIIDKIVLFITVVPTNVIRLWYSRVPLLYLPNGLLPAFLEVFALNFPLLQRGSIGVVVWSLCVGRVFDFVASLLKFLFVTPAVKRPVSKKVE
ncbi:DEKNAAC101261 [Brettanomyces naardenensis]|uniref:Golgi to ER traffic protein 1 n=1 Tax=Brettanomyces naardenensis TaxID=13370 RepID=A0A448YHP2_BRENA|nr:DEKNAAC101261 [Brettanomyces naardenensis]